MGVALITISVLTPDFSIPNLTLGPYLQGWYPLVMLILGAWIPCLCGNVYIVGLNQLSDIEIDRINKPQLPLVSGALSPAQGRLIVGCTGLVALLCAWGQGPYLGAMVSLSLAIGSAYSLPPIRLKRFAFWAALCILGVRGVIVNLGLYWHFHQRWVGTAGVIPPQIWALTGFIVLYTFAIAIFKDIPDLEGDRQFRIHTFTVQMGIRVVFQLARWVITTCYLGMMIMAWFLPSVQVVWVGSTHLGLLLYFWWRSLQVNLDDPAAMRRFYQLIWQLFFLEYLLFPLACLWP
jgi:homogentisate phytyltransferase/homogentisate geranylgeranyltransferase